jgi:putative sterol carrier protein
MQSQNRYAPNPNFGGRKEHDGFVCSSITRKTILGQNCVAVKLGETVQLRDTKDSKDTTLSFSRYEWDAFLQGVKKGEFDNA